MAELKNLIVIDITDYENIILSPNGIGATGEHDIKEIKANGVLLIKNDSQKSRLWNLNCDLKEIINTTTTKILNAGSINPGQEFKKEYDIQNKKEASLKVLETFDTERMSVSGKINNTFLYKNADKCNLKLSLTNILDAPFTEITVVREMPEIIQDIEIRNPNFGNAELGGDGAKRTLNWKIESLSANETAILEVNCTVIVKERKDQNLGALKINYLIDNKTLTKIDPEVRGETDSMSGVTRDEGSSPATWDCNVEFINDSEFKVRLEDVKVTHKIPTGTESVVSETPNIELEPESTWDNDFSIEGTNVPELESEIVFTPLYGVITRIIGEIVKESTYYNVLSAEVHKTIAPPEVAAYANTDMNITNTIPNLGTSTFETLEITDEIPPDFIPPSLKQVKIELKSADTIEIQERTDFIEKIEISPDNQDPESKHIITIKLKNLSKVVPAGSEVIMSYPILAKNPAPEVRYNTPVEIRANVPIRGNEFILSPPEEPVIKIKYVARKLKTLKSIKPGFAEGEFNISVRVQNKGDVELENLVIKDKIPAGFSLTEFTPPAGATHEVTVQGGASQLELKIPKIMGGNSVNISYSCSGTGEYPRTEPQVSVLGRGGSASVSEMGSNTETPHASAMSIAQASTINDIFQDIEKSLNRGINCEKFSEILEGKKDELPPGPILHQILKYSKDIKEKGDKMVVGSLRDEVDAKLTEFKNKYE